MLKLEAEELVVQHFQIPMQIRPDRKVSLAIKWLIRFARKRE